MAGPTEVTVMIALIDKAEDAFKRDEVGKATAYLGEVRDFLIQLDARYGLVKEKSTPFTGEPKDE